ncbi:FAD-binding protein [Rhodobacterales bacterium HKCCSP123]|nr:FAD-binding protein [Rhodobacterales bacterium HKCCSP123]
MNGMLTANAIPKDGSGMSWPIVVVGSGPGGAFAAIRLAELGHEVLVVEAGEQAPDLNWSDYFVIDRPAGEKRRDNIGLSWQLGGSSNLWAGRIAPLDPTDISREKGWPFDSAELDRHYASALERMGMAQIDELSTDQPISRLPSHWDETLKASLSMKIFQWSTPSFSTAKALREAMTLHENLSILTGCRLLSLECPDGTGRVRTGLFSEPAGERFRISGDIFILAMGGIETPRVLLNSAEGKGLGNSSGLLGRYLSTHPKMNVGTVELEKPVALSSPLFADVAFKGRRIRSGIGLPQRKDEVDPLNHYIQFTRRYERSGTYLLEQMQKIFVDHSGHGRKVAPLKTANAIAIALGRVAFNTLGRTGLLRRRARRLSVRAFLDQYPNPDCRVTLDSALDPHGIPKGKIQWFLSEEDVRSIRGFLQDMKSLFSGAHIGEFSLELEDDARRWEITGIHSHFMGTTRMGADRETSVTNADGRLHDAKNVFISGPSLFPSYGYANPFLTIAALALHLAEKVDETVAREKNGEQGQ